MYVVTFTGARVPILSFAGMFSVRVYCFVKVFVNLACENLCTRMFLVGAVNMKYVEILCDTAEP